jgi:UDP-N-acetylmuramyl tripeptide synthase
VTTSATPEAEHPAQGLRMRDAVAAATSRAAGRLSRLAQAGGGTSLPGVLVERLSPGFTSRRAATLQDGIVVVSGTNGKTTTASMIRSVLRHEGFPTVGNESGSNMRQGIATVMVEAPRRSRVGVFEIDEGSLVSLVRTLHPHLFVLTNIFRDQLDRYGEVERVAELLRRACELRPDGAVVIANADDPLLWNTVEPYQPIGFGVRSTSGSTTGGSEDRAAPSGPDAEPTVCPRCGAPLAYEERTIAHLGIAHCTNCSFRRAAPAYEARLIAHDGLRSITVEIAGVTFRLPTGGIHNAYNAAAAVAAVGALGIPAARAAAALETFRPRFGRAEELEVDGQPVWLALMKNPAGAGTLIREVASDPRVGSVVVSVNDLDPDGRDISWIWDVDFERLAASGVPLTPSGRRAADVAVRLKYAGADPAPARAEPLEAIRAASGSCPPDRVVVILATYTAMLEIRSAVLGGRAVRVADVVR